MRICEICGRTSSACLFCRRVDPTQPKQFSHRFHSNLLAAISSHRFHKSAQNLLVEKGLPQISQIYTDVGGYGILAIPTQPSYCDFLPQISQICTEPSYCDFLPQISQICTEPSCREGSPTDSTDLHRCRMVWHPAVPTQPLTQPTICVDQCNPWENFIPTERRIHSKHVPSVRICDICGSFFSAKHPKMQQKQTFFEKTCRNIWWFHKKAIPLHSL